MILIIVLSSHKSMGEMERTLMFLSVFLKVYLNVSPLLIFCIKSRLLI